MSAAGAMGALGFWIFITVVVAGGIWYDAKRKESQQETLRRIVESGRDIDPGVIDRIVGSSGPKELERDLKVGAYVVLAVAPGLFAMGWFLGMIATEARVALTGVALLVAFVGAGLFLAARLVEKRYADQ